SIEGLGPAKIATLLAAIELGLRLALKPSEHKITIKSPKDVVSYVMPLLRYEPIEHFAILLLDTKNQIIAFPNISTGSLNASIVHP
ncbi:JAB domain-containing protein, partial [Acinetobacter baumannii]|nr:JAB domain-containing protein [Acinetobacter baumannii]